MGFYEVYLPVLTTITTTFLAFLPMFFMKGMMGKFVYVIPLTISLALFMSLYSNRFWCLPAHMLGGLKTKPGIQKTVFWSGPGSGQSGTPLSV